MRQEMVKIEGVLAAVVDFDGGRAEVTYRAVAVRPEQLVEALNGTALRSRLLPPEAEDAAANDR